VGAGKNPTEKLERPWLEAGRGENHIGGFDTQPGPRGERLLNCKGSVNRAPPRQRQNLLSITCAVNEGPVRARYYKWVRQVTHIQSSFEQIKSKPEFVCVPGTDREVASKIGVKRRVRAQLTLVCCELQKTYRGLIAWEKASPEGAIGHQKGIRVFVSERGGSKTLRARRNVILKEMGGGGAIAGGKKGVTLLGGVTLGSQTNNQTSEKKRKRLLKRKGDSQTPVQTRIQVTG